MDETKSKPYFSGFSPDDIKYQRQVIDFLDDWDYSTGTPEILLSGSYGCLREDSEVLTADGVVPISNITSRDYLLTFHEKSNQFAFQQGSGAFPKGKGNLYRVISEHGEFVGSAHHLVATSSFLYERIEDLIVGDELVGVSFSHQKRHREVDLKWSLSDALRSYGTISSLINHYAIRIRQYDQRLQQDLKTFLDYFPLLNDAQEHGLFFYKNKFLHMDGLQELETILFRIFEQHDQIYKIRSGYLEGRLALVWEDVGFLSKFSEHTFSNTLLYLLYHAQTDRPKDLLLNLYRIYISFAILNKERRLPKETISSKIKCIEKCGDDWYWDLQVPNTNNYISGNSIHHNSAKSLLMAHLAVRHCLEWQGARVCLARKALPDLKATIFNEIVEHLENDPQFIDGMHYYINRTSASIKFVNGSEIISRSWADKKYNKGRSLKLSMLVFEELTENSEDDYAAFKTLKARLRRIPQVKENILIGATNPDDPDHWVAKYFIDSKYPTRKVFYSITTDNPFLDPVYIEQLKQDLSPAEAERYIYGKWTRLDRERIYSSYSDENFIKRPYEINKNYPITICHDFNIGEGKPMSAACYQFINDEFHIFKEFVISGARTQDLMEAMKESGLFDLQVPHFIIHGDGSGFARDTRSFVSDYDIIVKFISNQTKAKALLEVPRDNPPVRARHNKMNAYFLNEAGKRRAFVYQDCKVADEGFRLTALKKGGDYIEDDSKYYQHITTAIGYGVYYDSNKSGVKISSQKVR